VRTRWPDPRNPRFSVSVVFVAVMFMTIMDSTVVNVALPTLRREFGVSTASVSAVVTSYLVAVAVVMPASGWLGDRVGGKRVLAWALALFTAASAACGAATSLPELVACRAVQGAGAGVLIPVGMTMLYRTFPQAERIRATRLLMVPTLLAPATGPVLGGAIVDGLSWRWIFYVNVPVGVAALAFGAAFLPRHREYAAGRFDLPGFALAALGFPLVMYAFNAGPGDGWAAPGILAAIVAGLVLLTAFTLVEVRTPEPMLDLRILANRLFRAASLQTVAGSAGFIGVLFLVPLFLQNGLGFSALHSGLSTFPEALGGMTGIQISSRLYRRVGPRRLMVGGLLAAAVPISLMASLGPADVDWAMPVLMFGTGMFFGFSMAPAQTAALAAISMAQTGRATTLFNVQRQVGQAIGVAVLATVLAAARPVPPDLGGYHLAFGVAAVAMLVGAMIASRVRDADAAVTMAGPAKSAPAKSVPAGSVPAGSEPAGSEPAGSASAATGV
jgi:EmrB/QacA subfamily drug resistance transporter